MPSISNSSESLKSHGAVPRIIDQFERKRCQKKRKDATYQLLSQFFQRYFVSIIHDYVFAFKSTKYSLIRKFFDHKALLTTQSIYDTFDLSRILSCERERKIRINTL